MNLAALECSYSPTYFLDYKAIQEIERIAREIIQPVKPERIGNPALNGDYIHGDYPLISPEIRHTKTELLNSALYKTKFIDKYGIYIPNRKIGSQAMINDEYQLIESTHTPQTKVAIEKRFVWILQWRYSAKLAVKRKTLNLDRFTYNKTILINWMESYLTECTLCSSTSFTLLYRLRKCRTGKV